MTTTICFIGAAIAVYCLMQIRAAWSRMDGMFDVEDERRLRGDIYELPHEERS